MKRNAFGPINWAKNVPPMLRADGRADTTAHHVLLVLATYAKVDGSEARPGVKTLAEECYMTPKSVAQALDRIQAAGLISKSACLTGGTVVWRLHLEIIRAGPSVVEQQVANRRQVDAARQRRYRGRKAERDVRHALPDRDVTASQGVTQPPPVTAWHAECHGVAGRESRRATPLVTHPRPLQPQVTPATTALELPKELPKELTTAPQARVRDDPFDAFWTAYPRKIAKQAARRAWDKAIKDGAVPDAITAGAHRFTADRANQDPKYTPYPASWLNAGRWEDEPERPQLRAVSGGYQPWRNPADQDVYDQELY